MTARVRANVMTPCESAVWQSQPSAKRPKLWTRAKGRPCRRCIVCLIDQYRIATYQAMLETATKGAGPRVDAAHDQQRKALRRLVRAIGVQGLHPSMGR